MCHLPINPWDVQNALKSSEIFQVSSFDGKTTTPVTSNFVQMAFSCTQGSFIDLPVRRNATRISFELKGQGGSYAGLSEVEIYENGGEIYER